MRCSCKTHCCIIHGCKYGYKDCPVCNGEYMQKYFCETCVDDIHENSSNLNWEEKDNIEEQYLQKIQKTFMTLNRKNKIIKINDTNKK